MSWLQLVIAIEKSKAFAIEDLLLSIGAVSVTLQDNQDNPILEPGVGETPLWKQVKLTALFGREHNQNLLLEQLYNAYCDTGLNEPHISQKDFSSLLSIAVLEDKDWEREWLDDFEPIQCGNRLWICPSWCLSLIHI